MFGCFGNINETTKLYVDKSCHLHGSLLQQTTTKRYDLLTSCLSDCHCDLQQSHLGFISHKKSDYLIKSYHKINLSMNEDLIK